MKIHGTSYRTIWLHTEEPGIVQIIDQRPLPHFFVIEDLKSPEEVIIAIKDMHVRGAPLIGVAAAYGIYLAAFAIAKDKKPESYLQTTAQALIAARPTAVNLFWAVKWMLEGLTPAGTAIERFELAQKLAKQMADDEVERSRLIGEYGVEIIAELSKKKNGAPVKVLTHCNAGWLACIDYGTATAPLYAAAARQIPVHVFVDETRPRNQGASLTAWELLENGIPHTIIADNTGGHLMQHGMVDCVIVGADRVTRCGDAANKIGTYLKALAAKDNGVPFYVAIPSSSFDFNLRDGVKEIEIEERSQDEVKYIHGLCNGKLQTVLLTPQESRALNIGFDVTPARLISNIITERGICKAEEDDIIRLFPQ